MREIVHVQLGTFSNYVGAHFWNLQDEYISTPAQERELSPSVFFRPGRNAKLPYAPRLQIVDLSGSFGSLSLDSGAVLSETPAEVASEAWDGAAITRRHDRIPPSRYIGHLLEEEEKESEGGMKVEQEQAEGEDSEMQQINEYGLDEGVRYWSDFLKTRLHSRTCFSLPGKHAGVSDFDKFDHGFDGLNQNVLDDMFDDLRFFLEECDSLGGLHVLSNASDGFSGLSSRYLTSMRDELGTNASILVIGSNSFSNVEETELSTREKTVKLWDARLSECRLISECIDLAVQYVPLDAACTYGMEYVHPQDSNDYHSSGVLGLALSVASSPVQLTTAQFSTGSLLSRLRPSSLATVSTMFTTIPLERWMGKETELGPMYNRKTTTKLSTRSFTSLMKSRVPASEKIRSERVNEVVSARGNRNDPALDLDMVQSVTLPVAFPKFFDSRIAHDSKSYVPKNDGQQSVSRNCELEQVRCLAGFATSAVDGSLFLQCLGSVSSQALEKPAFTRGLDVQNLEEVAEKLTNLGHDYTSL